MNKQDKHTRRRMKESIGTKGDVYKDEVNKRLYFYGRTHPLSNMYPVDLIYAGIPMRSSEQAFMYAKAKHFGDTAMQEKLAEPNITGFQAKRYGRQVTPFDPEEWDNVREQYMSDVLHAKFSSNAGYLDAFIEDYREYEFVEASPYDLAWGIGVSVESIKQNPNAYSQAPGDNKLGRAMTDVKQFYVEVFDDMSVEEKEAYKEHGVQETLVTDVVSERQSSKHTQTGCDQERHDALETEREMIRKLFKSSYRQPRTHMSRHLENSHEVNNTLDK